MIALPPREIPVTDNENGMRLDRFVAGALPDVSRAMIQDWILDGRVKINTNVCRKSKTLLREGQMIVVYVPPAEEVIPLLPESFDLPILYEDLDLLVIAKPAGLVVHPAPGHAQGTLVNALLSHVPELVDTAENEENVIMARRPGIVHRLDKDTSGCLVVAKNEVAQFKLAQAFAERQIQKTYIALTYHSPIEDCGRIENQIGRHPANRQKMAVLQYNGRTAVSEYRVIGRGSISETPVGFVEVDLHTGRTHQIRVHMSHLKCPILGDRLYGGKQPEIAERQMLHARTLSFNHPVTGQPLSFTAPVPEDFQSLIDRINWTNPLPAPYGE